MGGMEIGTSSKLRGNRAQQSAKNRDFVGVFWRILRKLHVFAQVLRVFVQVVHVVAQVLHVFAQKRATCAQNTRKCAKTRESHNFWLILTPDFEDVAFSIPPPFVPPGYWDVARAC